MRNITKRPFMILSDCPDIYDFMVEIYDRTWRNGVPAPFLEYALSSGWSDKSFTHRNMVWEDNGKIVGFCFYESILGRDYFSLRPGYEELAHEMVEYAINNMADTDGKVVLIIFRGQDAIMEAAKDEGFVIKERQQDMIFDFKNTLDYKLPDGFSFAENPLDVGKALKCCWKGFDHEAEEGPWNGDLECGYHRLAAPHSTPEYPVAVENQEGEYVCYAGMWWTPQNKLAYMEPLCTIPEYRGMGLAAAALSEMYRRTKALGATHMTGGSNLFYKKIGYEKAIEWTYWEKA
jgi:GNAT superfamily N-acetyltransferase